MEWVCKRMGQPQDKGDESVVRLRGLPYEISKEEIVQFFTGKIKFFIFHNSKWHLFKSDVELKRPRVVLKNAQNLECLEKNVSTVYMMTQIFCSFVHSTKTNISSPEINLSTLNRPFPSWCKSPFQS